MNPQVIPIQSDRPVFFWFSAGCGHGWIQRDLPISPVLRRVAAMERSKVIYLIQVCCRQLGPHQEGLLWPSHEVHWIPWGGPRFSGVGRQPNTLGRAGLDSQLPAISRSADEAIDFSPLSVLLHFLPHFLPPSVKPLIQHYLFDDQLRYDPACFDYLQSNGFLPGTSSEAMDRTYTWPLSWTILFDGPGIKEALELFAHSHPILCHLVRALGPHFHRFLIHALVAHFPALLNATLWGLRSGHTSLCVQGIFGSGKTYSASLLLILLTSVIGLRTVLTADPNLPLATAAENISDLLRDAHQDIRSQYARCLAQNIPKTTRIDVLSVDRSQLFQPDSLLRCLLVTQGSILRDATSAHPLFTSFLLLCCLAINDEAQQGGQSGFTILAALVSRFCLQIFTGDRDELVLVPVGTFLKKNCSSA